MKNRHTKEKRISEKKAEVLVLGEDTRSFLSVIRSLGESGYSVHVVCYDKTSPALSSKYIQTEKYYNYQSFSQEEWLDNVISLIDKYQFDLVIPCDERAIYPLWSAKDRLPAHTKLAIANQEGLDSLFDKWKTKQVAIACEVPVASGKIVDLSLITYDDIVAEFGRKFVVKPLQSFEQSKLNQRQKVAIIESESDYQIYCKSNDTKPCYLVESFFSGKGEGLSVLSIEGHVYAAFAHVRVAEPVSGGGSSYRKSVPVDNELLEATKAICQQTQLTGVAMFEFRRSQSSHDWILVEVNARFWGSLPLAIYAGVDFPKLYADYLIFGEKPELPVLNYRNGVYARILTADLYEIKRECEILEAESGKLKAYSHLLSRLVQIVRACSPAETIDSYNIRDLSPFLMEVKMLIKSLTASIFHNNKVVIQWRRHQTKKQLSTLLNNNINRRIIFVCYGNIMRSPFGEVCLKALSCENNPSPDCDSFGFHLIEQRSCPEKSVQAAHDLGYDLSTHQSKWLTQSDLNETDIVIYFDHKNRDKLTAYYRVNHAFCAADLLDNDFPLLAEIEDPYDGGFDDVTACYQQIQNAVTNLMNIYMEVAR